MMKSAGGLLLFLSLLFFSPLFSEDKPPRWHNIKVHVLGLKSDRGTVRLALYNKRLFMSKKSAVRAVALPARRDSTVWLLNKIDPGEYAIVAYHDENDNNQMDKNFLGRAQEPYTFSGLQEKRGWGAPKFEEVSFTVDANLERLDLVFPKE